MNLCCRLCLAKYPENKLENIFLCSIKYSKESLVDVLFWVFSVEIDVTDPYTKDICSECILLIEYVVEIRNTFQKNQELLRKAEYEKEGSGLHFFNGAGVSKLDSKNKSVSPTHSLNKHSYSQSSPRVRVTLATLDALCPLRLNIVRFEDSPEYMHYKPLGHGRFKRMKYRHFRLDDKLLDDICSTLDDKEVVKNGMFKSDAFMVTQANNTDQRYKSHSSALSENGSSSKADNEDEFDTESLTEIIKITKHISSHMLSAEIDKDYDWTSLNFKKDASTNTESNKHMKKVDAETITEVLEHTVNKNTVKVNVQSLSNFSPKVWLEPVEYLMGRENYKEIDDFCFIKGNVAETEDEVKLEQYHQDRIEGSQEIIMNEKKQRFLDYYKNFSSFAVRELIAGKKIRETGNESASVFRVSNVHNVFVCNFCSKSFLTETVLNMHCKRAHRSIDTSAVHAENDTSDKMQRYKKFMLRKVKKRRGRKKRQLNKNDTQSIVCNIKNINFHREESNNIDSTRLTSEMCGQPRDFVKLSSNNVRELSLGLRTKSVKTNYNINSMVKNTTVNHISNGPKRRNKKNVGSILVKKCRKSKLKKSMESDTKNTYIWDRKGLGTYSAITFYRKHVTADSEVSCNEKSSDLNKKEDNALNETIRKLADRLEELENADNSNLYPT